MARCRAGAAVAPRPRSEAAYRRVAHVSCRLVLEVHLVFLILSCDGLALKEEERREDAEVIVRPGRKGSPCDASACPVACPVDLQRRARCCAIPLPPGLSLAAGFNCRFMVLWPSFLPFWSRADLSSISWQATPLLGSAIWRRARSRISPGRQQVTSAQVCEEKGHSNHHLSKATQESLHFSF